ncbi:MAG: pollen Ole e 1 allergen/extensin family protein [Flavobacteriales bacterium]|nr:pollen Ole e 1 allergen/extensin family protein [Flavobacteriales bacterium]
MRLLTSLTVALLAFAGCEKKSDVFMFDCVVFDEKVDAPVAGASVVMKVQNAAGGFNPVYVTVGTGTTDANGRFYIEVEKNVYYSFRVEVSHSKHFDESFDINPDDVPFSTAYSTTFELEPKAWISTHLINQNSSQTATFKVVAASNGCADCCQSTNTIVQGSVVDSVFTCQVYGEQQIAVNGNYADVNGATHQIAESAFATAFDTTVVTIIY